MTPRSTRRLLLGTNNPSKLEELRRQLSGVPFVLVSPNEVGITLEVTETGVTFAENALLKARAYAEAAGLAALADDSGLCVGALDGQPGIHSARFENLSTSSARNQRLLDLLRDVPEQERGATFVCVIAFHDPHGQEWTVEGRVRGRIALRERGDGGFGYDPLFLIPELGATFGERPERKDDLSHRARAVALARKRLKAEVDC